MKKYPILIVGIVMKNLLIDSFFNNINGYQLDKYQRRVIVDNSNHLLVVAAAGSGKTLTIIGKVKYLIEKIGIKEDEILCLSFTNETVNNLKEKIGFNVDVFTFHKLALNILKDNDIHYYISQDNLLYYITNEYFLSMEKMSNEYNYLLEYFDNVIDFKDKKFEILKRDIVSFIKKIKCNNKDIKFLYTLKRKCHYKKDKIFLIFAFSILKIYMEELLSELKLDFDDMIIYAKNMVEKGCLKRNYKYIIIDEYQDISKLRFDLVKAILDKTKAKLMCVGDDYQAIYGFSGSNVSLFIDFFKYFSDAKRIDIKNTYRNSYELIHLSLWFVMKNNYQLRKNVYATFFNKNPVVLVYYDDNNYLETYNNLLNYLYLEEKKDVLVLARYNYELKIVEKENNGMNIKYLTVHRSKGLECENVILLKASNEYLGFPSKIMNNKIFSLIDKNNEEIDYAEERRLFYVALTRCKDKIYILVPRNNPSYFIEEIKNRCAMLLLK